MTKTGTVNVYVRHSAGFYGCLRPAYDSAPDAVGEMTETEVSTLQSMINRYVKKCSDRRLKDPNRVEGRK